MKKMNFKSESGFTLMELMVVIGVLAILIAILLPQFTGYTAQAQAVSAASQAKNALTAGYSYYVSATSRDGAFDGAAAFKRMSKAVKNDGKFDGTQASSADGAGTIADETKVVYEITKGDLTFTATLDLSTGNVITAASTAGAPYAEKGGFQCTDNGSNVCKDLLDEGALKIQ